MALSARVMLIAASAVAAVGMVAIFRPMWIVQGVVAALSVAIALGLLGGFFFALIIGIEQIRRWRADRGGFGSFLAAGAPHDHPALIAAVTGQPIPPALAEGVVLPAYDLHDLGILPIVDGKGKLAVGDVMTLMDEDLAGATLDLGEPLPERLAVSILRARQDGDQRVAAACLGLPGTDLTETAVLKPAWRRGEREEASATRSIPTVGVDSASVALGSPQGLRTMHKRADRDPDGLAIGPEDGSNPYLAQDASALWRMTGTDRNPVIMMLSGLGDGSYPLWAAYDARDRLLGLILDFQMMPSEAVRRPVEKQDAAA